MEREDFEKLIEKVKVMPLRPGDRVVLRMAEALTDQGRENVVAIAEALFPGHSIVVLDAGADIDIVREEPPVPLLDPVAHSEVKRLADWIEEFLPPEKTAEGLSFNMNFTRGEWRSILRGLKAAL